MLNIRAKRQDLLFPILNIIRAKHQNRAWLSLILYCMLTIYSDYFTTSYLVLRLTVPKISITKGLFFSFWLSVVSYSDFWYYRSLLYYGKFLKKWEKTKKKLKTIYPKNHEIFKSSKPRVRFHSSYKKKNVVHCVKINVY